MNTKKETAIVFGATKNFAFAIASVLMDLKKFDYSWITEVVIFHDGISDKQQKLLNSILPCVFERYNFPIKDKSRFDQNILNYFSEMVFSKFECFRLLNFYKNVIWLDYDIVIMNDISELISYSDPGFKILPAKHNVLDQLNQSISDYDMSKRGVSTATFVLQDHLDNYNVIYDHAYQKADKYSKYLRYPEQAIFDFIIQDFNLKLEFINWDTYAVHPDELDKLDDAIIIHSYGHKKFWNEIKNENWLINYSNWLKMGGDKYNIKKYLIKKKIRILLENFGIYNDVKKVIFKLKKYIIIIVKKYL